MNNTLNEQILRLPLEDKARRAITLLQTGSSEEIKHWTEWNNGIAMTWTDDNGEGMAHWAARWAPHSILPLILNAWREVTKLDLNVRNETDNTPLHLAARRGDIRVLKQIILFPGANIHLLNSSGYTPLLVAIDESLKNDHYSQECIKLLIHAGSDVDATDYDGNSILHMIVNHRKIELIDKYLDIGVNPTIRNIYNRTAGEQAEMLYTLKGANELLNIHQKLADIEQLHQQNPERLIKAVFVDTKNGKGHFRLPSEFQVMEPEFLKDVLKDILAEVKTIFDDANHEFSLHQEYYRIHGHKPKKALSPEEIQHIKHNLSHLQNPSSVLKLVKPKE